MALAGDEYEGPSSTVSVSNGSGLFSLAAPCLGKGLAQKGTDLYLKWKAVFKGMLPPLITPPILNPSHALVKISARRERHGPIWIPSRLWSLKNAKFTPVSAPDFTRWYALSQTIVSVLKIRQQGLSKQSSFLMELVEKSAATWPQDVASDRQSETLVH